MTKKEDDALYIFFCIALGFILIGVVWAFGAYGVIGIGAIMLALIFWRLYKDEKTSRKS
jgi:hypothetical protein